MDVIDIGATRTPTGPGGRAGPEADAQIGGIDCPRKSAANAFSAGTGGNPMKSLNSWKEIDFDFIPKIWIFFHSAWILFPLGLEYVPGFLDIVPCGLVARPRLGHQSPGSGATASPQ